MATTAGRSRTYESYFLAPQLSPSPIYKKKKNGKKGGGGKDTVHSEKVAHELKKICANHISNKGFLSRIHKELLQLNNKRQLKIGKGLKGHLSKKNKIKYK